MENNLQDAITAYIAALKIRPKNGHTQFALANAMESLGDKKENIKQAYTDFLTYWENAEGFDKKIKHARSYLKSH